MKPILVVENVSKKYSRNANAHRAYGIRDLFAELLGRNARTDLRPDEFFAVNDVSFHLNPGDTLALIGRNGAGKTTMLKMMNGLTKPDAGTIVVDGSVQALINLGAGFNPALSGRDNILNSAALMGMGSKETKGIVGEVIDFAELDAFIDSPVETYSSGMKARLGFGVAVHLKPDIMLVDEVLAVGDYAFKNKCFVKMHELKKEGVTIILVSHSHTSVLQLCERALWLHEGRLMGMGPAKETVQAYLDFLDQEEIDRRDRLKALRKETEAAIEEKARKPVAEGLYNAIYDEFDRIDDLRVALKVDGRETDTVRVHDEVVIEYAFRLKEPVSDLNVTICFYRKDGLKMNALSTLNGDLIKDIHEGEVRCRVRIPDFNLNPGHYVVVLPIHEGKSFLYRNVVKEFMVTSNGRFNWELVDFRYEYEVEGPGGHGKRVSFLD